MTADCSLRLPRHGSALAFLKTTSILRRLLDEHDLTESLRKLSPEVIHVWWRSRHISPLSSVCLRNDSGAEGYVGVLHVDRDAGFSVSEAGKRSYVASVANRTLERLSSGNDTAGCDEGHTEVAMPPP